MFTSLFTSLFTSCLLHVYFIVCRLKKNTIFQYLRSKTRTNVPGKGKYMMYDSCSLLVSTHVIYHQRVVLVCTSSERVLRIDCVVTNIN